MAEESMEINDYIKSHFQKIFQIPKNIDSPTMNDAAIHAGLIHALATGQNVTITSSQYDQYRLHIKVLSQFNSIINPKRNYIQIEGPITGIITKRHFEILISKGEVPDNNSNSALSNLEASIIRTLDQVEMTKYATFEPQIAKQRDELEYTRGIEL